MEKIFCIEDTMLNLNNNYDYTIKIIAGHLTVKTFILPAMAIFNKKHPNIKFQVNTYPFNELIQKVRNNEADLVFFASDELNDEYHDLAIKEICELQDILVSSENVRFKYPDRISLLELNKYPAIAKTNNSISRKKLDEFFVSNGKIFVPTFEISKYWLVIEYIKLGLGMGLLTKQFIEKELKEGSLSQIETVENIPARKLMCAMKKNSAGSNIFKEFLKVVKSENM